VDHRTEAREFLVSRRAKLMPEQAGLPVGTNRRVPGLRRSEEFRQRRGAHDVRHHGTGVKTFHHPVVGELTVAYEGLELAAEPGLTLTIYTAEPGSPSEEALRLLASWASPPDQAAAVSADSNT
jgi:MmyB-like transcription regulator ligand binding domain